MVRIMQELLPASKINRILIVLPNWIGDIVFTTPALHQLRQCFPAARIAAMGWPGGLGVLENNPDVNDLIPLDEEILYKGVTGKLRLLRTLKSGKYDCAVFFSRSRTRAFLCFLAGIPRRMGYATRGRNIFLSQAIRQPPYDGIHRVEFYLELLRRAGLATLPPYQYVFGVSAADLEWVRTFLASRDVAPERLKILMNPGGNWSPKRWSPENFGAVARWLIEQHDAAIILTGAAKDEALCRNIQEAAGRPLIITAGQTVLGQLAALIQLSDIYIGNDSGPTHLAHGLGVPIVALYGPQDPQITGPYGRSAHTIVLFKNKGCKVPCYLAECEWKRCIDEITVDDVLSAAKQLLSRMRNTAGQNSGQPA